MAGIGRELDLLSRSPTVLFFSLGERLAPRLPRPLAYRLADVGGVLTWLVNRPARLAVIDNLSHVLGRKPPPRLVREVFRHGARNYYDTFSIPTLSRDALLDLFQLDGWELLDRALAEGRGAIMVAGHISSVALAGQFVAAKGYAITTVSERVQPPELDELLLRLRTAGGVRVLPLGRDTMKELLASLRRNEIVGLVTDREVAGTGVDVPFFGAPARLPGGAALLALRTGAPIVSAVAYRTPEGRFRGSLGQPVQVQRGAALAESVRLTTTRIAQRFEELIRAEPGQWTVFQPLWAPGRAAGQPEKTVE